MFRVEADRLVVILDGAVLLSLLRIGEAAVVEGDRVIWGQPESTISDKKCRGDRHHCGRDRQDAHPVASLLLDVPTVSAISMTLADLSSVPLSSKYRNTCSMLKAALRQRMNSRRGPAPSHASEAASGTAECQSFIAFLAALVPARPIRRFSRRPVKQR